MSQTATMPEATPAPIEAPVDTTDADLGAAYDRVVTQNGADRGDGGKFVSPNGSQPAAEGAETAETGLDEPKAPDPAVAAVGAPAHLPQAIKAHWDKYGPEAQAAIAAHQTEMDRKFGEVGKQLGQIKPLQDELAMAMERYPDLKGMTPTQLAQSAVRIAAVQMELNRNPVGTLIDIAKQVGALDKLAAVFTGQGGQGEPGQVVASLERKIHELETRLSRAADPDSIRETVSTQLDETMAEREARTSLKDWSKDQPFYAEVEADLPYYVGKVIAERGRDRPHKDILSDAYDMAINANPEVRAKVRAAEAKATAAPTDPKRTEAARKAASINVPSTTSGRERVPSEDELLAAAYDRKMAS